MKRLIGSARKHKAFKERDFTAKQEICKQSIIQPVLCIFYVTRDICVWRKTREVFHALQGEHKAYTQRTCKRRKRNTQADIEKEVPRRVPLFRAEGVTYSIANRNGTLWRKCVCSKIKKYCEWRPRHRSDLAKEKIGARKKEKRRPDVAAKLSVPHPPFLKYLYGKIRIYFKLPQCLHLAP